MSMPYIDRIGLDDSQAGRVTFILAGRAEVVDRLRRPFSEGPGLERLGPAAVERWTDGRVATDDWPFLYLRTAGVPALNLRNALALAVISLAMLWLLSPRGAVRLNPQMLFLGAGFMLLETKSVVQMALLFGSTWIVNAVVFAAILVAILASAVFVIAIGPRRLRVYEVLLVLSVLLSMLVPMHLFLGLPGAGRVIGSAAVTFAPIFFAGIVFAASFHGSTAPDGDLASNVAGAILGGWPSRCRCSTASTACWASRSPFMRSRRCSGNPCSLAFIELWAMDIPCTE
jgi:hypothetical protein